MFLAAGWPCEPVPADEQVDRRLQGARDHQAGLISADHRGARRRGGIELHDAGPFGDGLRVGARSPAADPPPPHLPGQ